MCQLLASELVCIDTAMQQDYGFQVSIWRLYKRLLANSLSRFHGEKPGMEHLNALILVLFKIRMAAMIPPSQLPSPTVRMAQLLMQKLLSYCKLQDAVLRKLKWVLVYLAPGCRALPPASPAAEPFLVREEQGRQLVVQPITVSPSSAVLDCKLKP